MGVLFFDGVQILPEDGFAAHGVYQRYLYPGKLDVSGHEVKSLRVMENTFAGEVWADR